MNFPNKFHVMEFITIDITSDITTNISIDINSIDIDLDINNINIDVDINDVNIDIAINIDINMDIDININTDINIDVKIENIENVCLSVNDRNNIRMSSDFACEHLFDPNKMMRSSEINEIAEINRFHRFFDRSFFLLNRSIDYYIRLMSLYRLFGMVTI